MVVYAVVSTFLDNSGYSTIEEICAVYKLEAAAEKRCLELIAALGPFFEIKKVYYYD